MDHSKKEEGEEGEEAAKDSEQNSSGDGSSPEEEKEKMDLSYGQNSEELLKDLRVGCVSDSSKMLYESSNVLFLFYIFQCKKYLMHKIRIQTIGSLSYGIQDEREKTRTIKNTIKKLLQKADEPCPLINFKEYNAQDFMIYLLSLETKKN